MKKRNEAIDVAKGLAMLFVVMGHSIQSARPLISSFDVVVYFFLSGYCYNEIKYNQSIGNLFFLFKQRLKNLYLPFIKYGLVFVLLHNIFYKIHFYSIPDVWPSNHMEYFYTINDWLYAIFGIITFSRIEQLLVPFWFLPALFTATMIVAVISYIAVKFKLNEYSRAILILGFFSVFCFMQQGMSLDDIRVNKILRIMMIGSLGALIFYMGLLVKKYIKEIKFNIQLAIISLLFLIVNSLYGIISIPAFNFSSPAFYILYAIAGIYLTLYISNRIILFSSILKNIFKYIGTITIEVMALQFLSFKVVSLILIYIYNMPIEYLAYRTLYYGTLWDGIYCLAGISFPTLLMLAKKKFFNKDNKI